MKPIYFTLIIALGLGLFFIGNYNGWKHDAQADGKEHKLQEWALHTALLFVLSVVFFLPSLTISQQNVLDFEKAAAGLTGGALSGVSAAILGALVTGFGIPTMVVRLIMPILTTMGVKTARQKNRDKPAGLPNIIKTGRK